MRIVKDRDTGRILMAFDPAAQPLAEEPDAPTQVAAVVVPDQAEVVDFPDGPEAFNTAVRSLGRGYAYHSRDASGNPTLSVKLDPRSAALDRVRASKNPDVQALAAALGILKDSGGPSPAGSVG